MFKRNPLICSDPGIFLFRGVVLRGCINGSSYLMEGSSIDLIRQTVLADLIHSLSGPIGRCGR